MVSLIDGMQRLRLEYIKRFPGKGCIWLAKMADEQRINQTVVVKFAYKCSEIAHHKCAELKIAPTSN